MNDIFNSFSHFTIVYIDDVLVYSSSIDEHWKQRISPESPEQIVRFYSGIWNNAQLNYSTIKKDILSIVLCISKFQSVFSSDFFLRERLPLRAFLCENIPAYTSSDQGGGLLFNLSNRGLHCFLISL